MSHFANTVPRCMTEGYYPPLPQRCALQRYKLLIISVKKRMYLGSEKSKPQQNTRHPSTENYK